MPQKLAAWLAAMLGVVMLSGCKEEPPAPPISGETMGTTWSLRLGKGSLPPDLQGRIQAHLDQREAMLSHWREDSAVTRFNDSPSTDWQPVPVELVWLVEHARGIANDTDGALDITIAPLIDLWGFGGGAGGRRNSLPSDEEIAAAKARCGWSHLQSQMEPPALRKDRPDVRINVASVTEGFVMDELVIMLRQEGVRRFLLELGGEVFAAGKSPDGGSWQVGIQTPDAESGDTLQTLPLSNQALCTSGTYRHWFEKDGRTYSHLIDPRTGRPVEHKLQSVSVIADRSVLADGYATAFMVLGPEAGRAAAERLHLRVVWIEAE